MRVSPSKIKTVPPPLYAVYSVYIYILREDNTFRPGH